MNEPQPFVPVEVAARLQSTGKLPFAFGPRFFAALLLGLLWIIPAWWSPRMIAALFLWDFLVITSFIFDLIALPKPKEILAGRSWEQAPAMAVASSVTLSVENFGKAAIRSHLVDETPASLRIAPPLLQLTVPAKSRAQIAYPILPRTRGDIRIGRLFLRYQTQFGFAERWTAAEIRQTVRVFPDLEQARQHALYLIRSRQVEMEKRRRRQRGQGREFESLRDYRQGDDARDVCWTATARRHHLTTRVFEIERSQAVWMVLDAGRLLRAEVPEADNDPRLSKLDYAVNAALSLAQVATQCGDRVGLLAYGRSVQQKVSTGRGRGHLRTIIDSLAQVHGEATEADHSSAARTLLTEQHRRSLVVWITDFAETPTLPEVIEYALQISRRHLVVFGAVNQPDLTALARAVPKTVDDMYRHAAALEISHRRDVLLRGLRQRGVLASELIPGLLASSLVNQYLDIKERNLL
jgi:uncharacterized protein (DUF58 family)